MTKWFTKRPRKKEKNPHGELKELRIGAYYSSVIVQEVSPTFNDTGANREVQTIDQKMCIRSHHCRSFNRHQLQSGLLEGSENRVSNLVEQRNSLPIPHWSLQDFFFVPWSSPLPVTLVVASSGSSIQDLLSFRSRIFEHLSHNFGPAFKVVVEDFGNLVKWSVLEEKCRRSEEHTSELQSR